MSSYLIVYDISRDDDRGTARARSCARLCEGVGQRVQASVFEAQLEPTEIELFTHSMKQMLSGKDSVRIYRIPYDSLENCHVLGNSKWEATHTDIVL